MCYFNSRHSRAAGAACRAANTCYFRWAQQAQQAGRQANRQAGREGRQAGRPGQQAQPHDPSVGSPPLHSQPVLAVHIPCGSPPPPLTGCPVAVATSLGGEFFSKKNIVLGHHVPFVILLVCPFVQRLRVWAAGGAPQLGPGGRPDSRTHRTGGTPHLLACLMPPFQADCRVGPRQLPARHGRLLSAASAGSCRHLGKPPSPSHAAPLCAACAACRPSRALLFAPSTL